MNIDKDKFIDFCEANDKFADSVMEQIESELLNFDSTMSFEEKTENVEKIIQLVDAATRNMK